ncbi:trichohyalin-like [Anopheles ziemanni]|uniref:trichohyalin-like n=1 Tax=Anopheles coustani TaxID=139045 RepID=UPI00265B2D49|nr:trichohyalin-like [Anopheles coustani]XP_058178412.1 trichohyalin-like [Anopheles ziemanni]
MVLFIYLLDQNSWKKTRNINNTKVILCVALLMLVGLNGASGQSNETNDSSKETPLNEQQTTVIPPSEEVTERANATRVLDALRAELARRRTERQQQQQQRLQERREQILQSLESLSDRKREYELRRQEALKDAEALREARRQEMEARRVGRLPVRERERYNRARLEQLAEETPQEENEIGDTSAVGEEELTRAVDSEAIQRVRNLLLIEEANGNLRLIDLDTEEGQQFVLESGQLDAVAEASQSVVEKVEEGKRKLKIGQI